MPFHPSMRLRRAIHEFPRHGAAAGALAAMLALPAYADVEVRTAAQEESKPRFVVTRQNGIVEIGGLCMDIMHAIERVDPGLRFVMDPQVQSLARIEAGLVAGELDAFCGLPRTPENEAAMRIVEPALFTARFHLAVRADDEVDIRDWDDVRRLGDEGLILMARDHHLASKLRALDGLKVDDSAKNPETGIRKLLAGRGRFFLHRSPGMADAIRAAGAQGKVKVLPGTMGRQAIYMALSRTAPAEMAARMHEALVRLDADGELKRLLEKWSDD